MYDVHLSCTLYCRQCTGMSELAYNLLTTEDSAEWVCDKCVTTKYIPTVRMVPAKSWNTCTRSVLHTHLHLIINYIPHSLPVHAFQNTDFLSLSCYFFHSHKKIQYDIQGELYTMPHTWTLWLVHCLDLVQLLIFFHVQFHSNVAVEIWVLPKKFQVDKK